MSSTAKTIIVTGANRGIGRAICQLLLEKHNPNGDLKLLATSRAGVHLDIRSPNVFYPKLDISNSQSIKAFASDVKANHGHVDVLINNAGVNLDNEYSPENARRTLDVNYRGTLEMCQSFIPLMSKQGRIVNLSSVGSSLKPYSEAIQSRFRDPDLTLEGLEALAQEFEASVTSRSETEDGFAAPGRSYSFSKACINAFTRILALNPPAFPDSDLYINACCPGWVSTDMGKLVGDRVPKTPEQGARIPVRLAVGDIDGTSGRYWSNDSVRSKEEGKVQEW